MVKPDAGFGKRAPFHVVEYPAMFGEVLPRVEADRTDAAEPFFRSTAFSSPRRAIDFLPRRTIHHIVIFPARWLINFIAHMRHLSTKLEEFRIASLMLQPRLAGSGAML